MIRDSVVASKKQPENSVANLISEPQPKDILILASGGGLALIGSIVERGIGYLYSAVLIWGLGAANFGLFTLATAINVLVGMVANLGLVQGVVRYGVIQFQTRERAGVHQITVGSLQVALPASLLFMLSMLWGADFLANIFSKPEITPIIKAMAVSIPFMTIQSLLLAATRCLKIMKYSVIVWVAQPLVALLLAILVMAYGSGMLAVSLAYSISYVLGACLASYYYLRLMVNKGKVEEKIPMAEMVKFSLPLSFVQWIYYANQRTEIFFLGLLPSTVDVGIYNIALRLAGLETILIDSLNKIFGPLTSELSHQRATKKLGDLYKTMAKWAFTGGWVLFLIYILFATPIMQIFDSSFVRGNSVLIALGFAQLINALTGPCGTVLMMSGRSGLSLLNTIILFGTSVLLDWLLIPAYGLTGATWAGVLTIVLVNILRVVEVWITLKIHPFRWDFIKPLTAGIVSFAVVYLLREVSSTSSLLVELFWLILLVSCYITMIFFLKVDQEDRMVLQAVQQKMIGLKRNSRNLE